MRPSANRAPDKREIALAEQLIGALEDRFDASRVSRRVSGSAEGLARRESEGKVVRFPKAPKRERTDSLIASLQASLKAQRKEAGGHGRRA